MTTRPPLVTIFFAQAAPIPASARTIPIAASASLGPYQPLNSRLFGACQHDNFGRKQGAPWAAVVTTKTLPNMSIALFSVCVDTSRVLAADGGTSCICVMAVTPLCFDCEHTAVESHKTEVLFLAIRATCTDKRYCQLLTSQARQIQESLRQQTPWQINFAACKR